ncbi:hypothetical protein GC101_17180 [Paenibacillus sp. LMG 31459]|uniref:HTH LytTR-type domain-containing protein n=1 Tax=Paenibacillus phytohabitans TaxID=2654978 RepID=A0ABX1YLP4_9BACL|nr:LytTR family transcriptional regulator DNA-binding domain-containing protein [Paenibacillus phytohabitans]NOU80599.1 hypothetical protein [Paenibacillus phytohabitans]
MDILSVAKDTEGVSGLYQLPVKEIAFMLYDKTINRVVVHTPDNNYYTMGTLAFWQEGLAKNGHRFMWVDRTNVVNIDCIKVMDTTRNIAYFDAIPNKNSKKCTLTRGRFLEVVERLGAFKTIQEHI